MAPKRPRAIEPFRNPTASSDFEPASLRGETPPPSGFPAVYSRLKTKLLFLCSRNQWRSPTAEALFKGHARYEARSAGTEASARVKVTAGHLGWANVIFCMERKHADRLRDRFPEALENKTVIILRIPDDYGFMDEALMALLRAALPEHLPEFVIQ